MDAPASSRARRWLKRSLWGLAILLLAPFVLTIAYAVIPPVSTPMAWRILTFRPAERRWVRLADIAPTVSLAVLTAEDAKFCKHRGVDWDALFAVMDEADEDGPSRGASTITMQTAKNLFLWNSRSYLRKGLEIPLALWLDLALPKRRVLEIYLNVAEWGEGTYGIEAAARRYYKKPAHALSMGEATLLAAALPLPRRRDPTKPTARQRALAKIIVGRIAREAVDVSCISPSGTAKSG